MYKKYNARAQLLFCLLNLLFRGVLVAVVVCFKYKMFKQATGTMILLVYVGSIVI